MSWILANSSASQGSENYVATVYGRIVLVGSNVVANINAFPLFNKDMLPFVEATGQPTAAADAVDPDNNFPVLDSNAAPSTVGIILAVGDASSVIDIQIPTLSISSLSMSAGVPSLFGVGNTGITPAGNICFVVSCTGLQLDAAVANSLFDVLVTYKIDQQAT